MQGLAGNSDLDITQVSLGEDGALAVNLDSALITFHQPYFR